jgi:hypothetical protein
VSPSATSIGEQVQELRENGTEAFDADDEESGNALIGTGHPNDPLEDPDTSINPFRDPTDWIQANAGIVAGAVAVIGVVAVVLGGGVLE